MNCIYCHNPTSHIRKHKSICYNCKTEYLSDKTGIYMVSLYNREKKIAVSIDVEGQFIDTYINDKYFIGQEHLDWLFPQNFMSWTDRLIRLAEFL